MINDRLVLVGVAALSAVATAGWLRQTPAAVMPQATNFNAPMSLAAEPLPIQEEPSAKSAAFSEPNQGVYRQIYQQPAQVAARRVSDHGSSRSRPIQRVYDDRRVKDNRVVATARSTAKSAAIIGGSAAAGAAIGAMAGGGKGAAIGALTGGAGGLVYDRMTRKQGNDTYRANDAVYDDQPYRAERSTKERVAIIGGGAAAGAAIGGLAGGGKGAAIGALGGGAAGYIYDRMTKNK
jgi:hypothetical protein